MQRNRCRCCRREWLRPWWRRRQLWLLLRLRENPLLVLPLPPLLLLLPPLLLLLPPLLLLLLLLLARSCPPAPLPLRRAPPTSLSPMPLPQLLVSLLLPLGLTLLLLPLSSGP